MPTYEYRCGACDKLVEFFQSMTESPKRKCPTCGKLKLQRQIGAGAGIIFKGSGYYQTDYRSEAYKKDAAADKPSSDSSSKDSSGSDTSSASGSKSKSSPKKSKDKKDQ